MILPAVLVAAALPIGAAPAVQASERTLSPTERSARVYPGVQLIEVDFSAQLSVPVARLDNKAVARLQQRITRQVLSGAVDATEGAVVEAVVDAIAKDPLTYFKPSRTNRTTSAKLSAFGTGWVVNPDGYVVTAAHVISPDPEDLKQEFALTALKQFAEQDARAFTEADSGVRFSSSQVQQLTKAASVYSARYLKLGNITKAVSAQIGVAVAGFSKSREGRPAEVVSVGEPYPGKDVAVLKLDGEAALPTLPVGKDSDVSEGETLYVAGYPAASTFFSGLSKDSEVQPTVTQGPLTAIKSNEAGTPIFQTQAPASPGNSGGPVLDARGNVVGILVASAVDGKGVALEGQEFIVPISVVNEKLKQRNITAQTSPVTISYNQALEHFYRKHYKRALPEFERVRNLYGAHPYVGEYISQSQTAIDAGRDETPMPLWIWLAIASAAVAILLGIGGGIFLARRRRRPGAPAAVPAPQYAFAGAPPGAPGAAGWPGGPPGYPGRPAYPPPPGQGGPSDQPFAAPDPAARQPYPPQPQHQPQQPYQPYGQPPQARQPFAQQPHPQHHAGRAFPPPGSQPQPAPPPTGQPTPGQPPQAPAAGPSPIEQFFPLAPDTQRLSGPPGEWAEPTTDP
jgi:serine protease Do